MNATDKQIALIHQLFSQAGYTSEIAAIDAYGFGLRPARDLTTDEASELIDWLRKGGVAAVKTEQPLAVGSPFTSSRGSGKIITRLSDDRFLVKFDDGRSDFLTAAEFTSPKMTTISDLTNEQISEAFAAAGMLTAAQRHGDVYNQLRAGQLSQVVGTLKAGASARTHKDGRRRLRQALREFGVEEL